jgi:hypothetical protein
MLAFAPVFADAVDMWIKIAIFGAVILYSIIKQLSATAKTAQRKAAAGNAAGGGMAEKSEQQKIYDEVEEFLRRAAAKQQEPPPSVPLSTDTDQQRNRSRRRKKSVMQPVAEVQPVEEPLENRHLASRLDTSGFDERASQLTKVGQAQEAMESHLQQVFGRQVGNLAAEATRTPPATQDDPDAKRQGDPLANAGQLAAMLANPQSIRQAIVMNEILTRPTSRW